MLSVELNYSVSFSIKSESGMKETGWRDCPMEKEKLIFNQVPISKDYLKMGMEAANRVLLLFQKEVIIKEK